MRFHSNRNGAIFDVRLVMPNIILQIATGLF